MKTSNFITHDYDILYEVVQIFTPRQRAWWLEIANANASSLFQLQANNSTPQDRSPRFSFINHQTTNSACLARNK